MKSSFCLLLIVSFFILSACGGRPTVEQRLTQAEKYRQSRQWRRAVDIYESLLREQGDRSHGPRIRYDLAMTYVHAGTDTGVPAAFGRAIHHWRRLVEETPDHPRVTNARFMIAYCYANHLKEYERAKQAYETFLKLYPDHELAASAKWELDHLGQDIDDFAPATAKPPAP